MVMVLLRVVWVMLKSQNMVDDVGKDCDGVNSSLTKVTPDTSTIHMDTSSVNNSGNGRNGDAGSENARQTCPNSASYGVGASPPISRVRILMLLSIRSISERFANTVYGFFLGKRVAYPIIANYVRNTWDKYGLVRSMLNSSTGLSSFQFSSMDGLDAMLENGPWFILNNLLILKKWHPNVNLFKEDVCNILIWVKHHGVPVMAFSEIGLRAIATKLDNIMVAMPKIIREGFYMCNIPVEYEWKPLKCACCKVFGHFQEEYLKNIGVGVTNNLKKPSQTPRGVPVGPKKIMKKVGPNKVVSKSNPFDVLNLVDNDVNLGTYGETSNLAYREANSSGSSFWNMNSSSPSTTPIIEKINEIKKLIIDGKVTFMDDEGKPFEKVDFSGDYDSEDGVSLDDNEMASFFARKDGYGTNSLLDQWKESYENDDYDYDLYDDDMYEVFYFDDLFVQKCKLYTEGSMDMNVDEAMKSEVVDDYSVIKIVVKLEELSVNLVSNDNMVNKQVVCKKERIIRRDLNTISSYQSKFLDIDSSDDKDLSVRVRVKTTEGETLFLTPARHAYNCNRMVSQSVYPLHSFSKLEREVKDFDLDITERVMEVVQEDMRNIASWMHYIEAHFNK
ncbi:retrotransposon protein, putative, unclassified [Tanacetum coccineum]